MSRYLYIILVLIVSSCSHSASSDAGSVEKSGQKAEASDARNEDNLDPVLWNLLEQRANVVKPFAWGGKEEDGLVTAIDENNLLRYFLVKKVGTTYEVSESPTWAPKKMLSLAGIGSGNLQQHLPDTEFPFEVQTLGDGGCQAHFILVESAAQRAFNGLYGTFKTNLRILLEKDNTVALNRLDQLSVYGVETAIRDVNGDGRKDLIVLGEDSYQHIRVYTLEPGCGFRQFMYEEIRDDGPIVSEYVSGRVILLKKGDHKGAYDIVAREYDFTPVGGKADWVETETVYKWDARREVYKQLPETVQRLTKTQMDKRAISNLN